MFFNRIFVSNGVNDYSLFSTLFLGPPFCYENDASTAVYRVLLDGVHHYPECGFYVFFAVLCFPIH